MPEPVPVAATSTAAELVRAARCRRGLTQRQLAHAAGVPQSTVSAVELARRQPTVSMLEHLLQAAGFALRTTLTNAIRPSVLLAQYHGDVLAVVGRFPVRAAWVFGSVARGDDGPDSDLDILVDVDPSASFDDYVGLADEIAVLLGCRVDVVTTRELESNAVLRKRVQRDLRPLEYAA